MTPQDTAEQHLARSGSSFYYAFRFLPAAQREALTAFYAYCRVIDDVVDEVSDPGVASRKLAWWRQEVQRAFTPGGEPVQHPVMRALQPLCPRYGITAEHLLALIEGCEMDIQQNRYLDFPGLARYCHLVAGVVGEVSALIFGQTNAATTAYAHKLGLALQLTNILRDVGEDARRGRIYLPISDLQQFDVKAAEILRRSNPWGYSERFTALMQFQAQRAHALYDEALALLPAADRKNQRVGLIMAGIYRTLLREIEHEQFAVLHQRIGLTPLRKLWIATRVYWLGR
ncbi:presqualene diphosphate synthase HpnD [Amphibiibacter pelophylacis]|uniref:Presqualene diphosphate synthase HpnD n=1 Tax=Amphibiibacter pelophylacis TaxID=1799477 RepID=A0ACC6P078_9BURK